MKTEKGVIKANTKETGVALDFDLKQELAIVANGIQTIIDSKDAMEQIAEDYLKIARNAFFIGRNMDFCVSLEGALKLKEISYIQAEGFAGGELKHGTIALIEEGTPVFALATQKGVALNIRGNVKEVVARGANACIIAMEGLEEEGDRLVIPHVHDLLTPLVSVVPLQLISYYAGRRSHRGYRLTDISAKSFSHRGLCQWKGCHLSSGWSE